MVRYQKIGLGTSNATTMNTSTPATTPSTVRMSIGSWSCGIRVNPAGFNRCAVNLMAELTATATTSVSGATQSNRVNEIPSRGATSAWCAIDAEAGVAIPGQYAAK